MFHFRPFPPRPKQIFASHANVHVSISYVLEVYEACKMIEDREERRDAYERYGVDEHTTTLYLNKVLAMERSYRKDASR